MEKFQNNDQQCVLLWAAARRSVLRLAIRHGMALKAQYNTQLQKAILVLLPVVSKDQILQLDLDLDPLLVGQCRPDMMRFGDGRLVGLEHHLGAVVVDVHGPQYQNESTERRVRRDRFQPVVVQVEQNHLRLCRLQYQVTKLLHLTFKYNLHCTRLDTPHSTLPISICW